jgi:hypothetical protein
MFSKLTESAMALLMNLVLIMQVAEVLPAVLRDRTTAASCRRQQQPAGSLVTRQPRCGHSRCEQHRSACGHDRQQPPASTWPGGAGCRQGCSDVAGCKRCSSNVAAVILSVA